MTSSATSHVMRTLQVLQSLEQGGGCYNSIIRNIILEVPTSMVRQETEIIRLTFRTAPNLHVV